MKSFFAKIEPDPNLVKQLPIAEAQVLSTVCHLSAQLRLMSVVFNIPHAASRLGWIIDPTPKIITCFPELTPKEVNKIITIHIKKQNLLSVGDPFAVYPNATQLLVSYKMKWGTVEIGDTALMPDDWQHLSRQEYWDHIPGVSDGLPKISLSQYVEKVQSTSDWVKQYRELDHAPAHILDASFLIFQKTGFVPERKDWIAAVVMLLGVANNKMSILSEGLDKGQEMRKKVSMTNIRSFQGAIRDVAASKRIVTGTSTNQTKQRIII